MVYSKRFERKYVIDFLTYSGILKDIKPFFEFDKNGDKNGCYIVSSLYYDSSDFRFYREKVDGEKIRSKLRLRTYKSLSGKDLLAKDKIFLEIKKRDNLNVCKKKILMFEEGAKRFIDSPILDKKLFDKDKQNALAEAVYLKKLYDIKPAVIVSYVRQAFVNKFGPKVRITFDSGVKYRNIDLNLCDVGCRNYILDPRFIIMELKYNEILPVWVSNIVCKHGLFLRTFGKYCGAVENIMQKREDFINKVNMKDMII